GLVVIEGGAGSGKTTVALHRAAFLHFQDPRVFRPQRMLIVVPTEALVRYVAGVLPALGVEGVPVVTATDWMRFARRRVAPGAPSKYREQPPTGVARAKKPPALWVALERFGRSRAQAAAAAGQKRPLPMTLWAELLTDRAYLREALPPVEFSDG